MIMKFTEVSIMLSDIWRLYKKYALRNLSDEEIEEFIDETQGIYAEFHTPFTKEIILAVVAEIERSMRHFERRK